MITHSRQRGTRSSTAMVVMCSLASPDYTPSLVVDQNQTVTERTHTRHRTSFSVEFTCVTGLELYSRSTEQPKFRIRDSTPDSEKTVQELRLKLDKVLYQHCKIALTMLHDYNLWIEWLELGG